MRDTDTAVEPGQGEWLGNPETAREAWSDFRAGRRASGASPHTSYVHDPAVPVL